MTSNRDLMKKCYGENYPHRCPAETPFPFVSKSGIVERGCRKYSHCMRLNKFKPKGRKWK